MSYGGLCLRLWSLLDGSQRMTLDINLSLRTIVSHHTRTLYVLSFLYDPLGIIRASNYDPVCINLTPTFEILALFADPAIVKRRYKVKRVKYTFYKNIFLRFNVFVSTTGFSDATQWPSQLSVGLVVVCLRSV